MIAAGFGLLRGLSFAALLGQLDLTRTNLVITLLGFNLGIEIAQLLVVAVVMPSLILLARTSRYPVFRISAAALGAVLATAWLAQRCELIRNNPLEPVADVLVEHPIAFGVLLAKFAVAGVQQQHFRAQGTSVGGSTPPS